MKINDLDLSQARPRSPFGAGALALLCLVLLPLFLMAQAALAASSEARNFDKSLLRTETGTANIDSADETWTSFVAVVTVVPPATTALRDFQITFDLDSSTAGWADNATSETIQFAVMRAIDGVNYRSDVDLVTTATSGTNSASRSATLVIGYVGPTERVKVAAKLSAEVVTNTDVYWSCYYTSADRATFTSHD